MHIEDRELLVEADGELTAARAKAVREHLERCWACRARRAELERAIGDFVRVYEGEVGGQVPPGDGPRALLRARLTEAAGRRRVAWRERVRWSPAWAASIAVLAVGALWMWHGRGTLRAFEPNARFTPGATRPVSREAVCSGEAGRPQVDAAMARAVFREYGIRHPEPRAYEVDYLIPPALGGADDPRNLWPQPYSQGVWNARVKDALEDRLRSLVCDGTLDLETAQRDLARDWIAAYKKYFRTDAPMLDHVAFVKDRPWE